MTTSINTELKKYHCEKNKYEIGIDEVGRGPMFGRLYVAGVILPKDDTFMHKNMKDSKKIHSHKKMTELSDYIKSNAVAWHIHFVESDIIDKINIRQAVLQAMKECAKQIMIKMGGEPFSLCEQDKTIFDNKYFLIVDGNDFPPYTVFNESTELIQEIPHITVEKGDNNYSAIAAASIIAKAARDQYIIDLCEEYPALKERYQLHKNMGYGTKAHMEGIKNWGISQWHRRSFGICKISKECDV
jgi:ribonuclease HII